ncbi:MAG TPA: DUF4350 domain-containing protein, partial [Pirellulales bacterium]|nr:DUF4350 domain-containing protein [Pirellulales bacterium]
RRLAVRSHSDLSCLVEDSRTGGGSGIRDWAERLGYATFPLRAPLREVAAELPSTGNCLITAGNGFWNPADEDYPAGDWTSVEKWLRAGNTLIVVTSNPKTLPEPITRLFTSDVPRSTADDSLPPTIESSAKRLTTAAAEERASAPTWWGGAMSVATHGPRLNNLPEELRLAGSDTASVLAGRPLGEGMVYLLLDEHAWTNAGFDRADNAATLARVLQHGIRDDGVLAFDEYRHGYGRVESFTTLFLSLPGAKDFAAMALAWGLFWLWGSTRRLYPADEYRETERHTAMEYIESVAAMNQRARAAPLVVGAVLERVRYLFQKRGILQNSATAVFDSAARHVQSAERPAAPNHEIELVSNILQLKQQFYGTRRDPRAQ